MRSIFIPFSLCLFFILVGISIAQNGGIARMKELRTNIDPIRSFDLPEDASRARIISTDFLNRSSRKMKKVFKKLQQRVLQRDAAMTKANSVVHLSTNIRDERNREIEELQKEIEKNKLNL
uniref:DUF148 domain-containing protein n=2 Tax=Caenorhabditis tropicalis TaxID=1561998 RepID=A0A1I7T9A9_9PELO